LWFGNLAGRSRGTSQCSRFCSASETRSWAGARSSCAFRLRWLWVSGAQGGIGGGRTTVGDRDRRQRALPSQNTAVKPVSSLPDMWRARDDRGPQGTGWCREAARADSFGFTLPCRAACFEPLRPRNGSCERVCPRTHHSEAVHLSCNGLTTKLAPRDPEVSTAELVASFWEE
jgi:hypothetical protein